MYLAHESGHTRAAVWGKHFIHIYVFFIVVASYFPTLFYECLYINMCMYAIYVGSLVDGDMCTIRASECVFELHATGDIEVRIMIVIHCIVKICLLSCATTRTV